MKFVRKSWDFAKRLYRAALDENASPPEVGWAVGIGAFIGCSPALGFHGVVALFAATLFKKNRLFCWLGSRVCNVLTLPFIVGAEIEVARLLRTGQWLVIDRNTIVDQAPSLLLDWSIGTVPVGGVLALVLGFTCFFVSRFRAKRRNLAPSSDLSHNILHEPERRVSGAPPPSKP